MYVDSLHCRYHSSFLAPLLCSCSMSSTIQSLCKATSGGMVARNNENELNSFKHEPNVLFNCLSFAQNEIRCLSLRNGKKIYNYHACTTSVRNSLYTTKLLSQNLRSNHLRLESIAAKYLTIGDIGKRISNKFELSRQAVKAYFNLSKLLEVMLLIDRCTHDQRLDEAIAIVNLSNGLKHHVHAYGESNWILADIFSEIRESTLALRLATARMLHRDVSLSESIGNTLKLRLLDTNLPSQNNCFVHVNTLQWTLQQEGYLLSPSMKSSWLMNRDIKKLGRNSIISGCGRPQWFETSCCFHAMFCISKLDLTTPEPKADLFESQKSFFPLGSWLSRHAIGVSRAAELAIFRTNSTGLQSIIDACMQFGAPLTHIGGSFTPSLVEIVFVKTRCCLRRKEIWIVQLKTL